MKKILFTFVAITFIIVLSAFYFVEDPSIKTEKSAARATFRCTNCNYTNSTGWVECPGCGLKDTWVEIP